MKLVFFGGGSHRYLSIARSVLAVPGLMEKGEIYLYDLAVDRAEAVGRLAIKSPEYAPAGCRITWGDNLDEALEGADIVFVVLMAGSRRNFAALQAACPAHGFLGSDQLSPSGAMLALKGGPILMDLAKKMESVCPDAWLVDFANPVAVLSAAVNNHTKTRCLGVCAGYTNHQWDLTRLLYGKDEQWSDYEILCAGINHMSFILRGSTHRGRDLYELAEEILGEGWTAPEMSNRWNERSRENIANGIRALRNLYKKYDVLVFSSEGDGMAHLDMEGHYMEHVRKATPPSPAELDKRDREINEARAEADRKFRAWLDADLDEEGWNAVRSDALYLLRADEDIMVKIARALGGVEELSIATSYPSGGAVRDFKKRAVLEYSQILGKDGIRPAGEFDIPNVFHGLVSALSMHQALLGDAIATRDPRVLFEALYSYPVKQDMAETKALWRELLQIAADEIPEEFQQTRDMFLL